MDHPLLMDMAIHTFDQCRQLTGADPLAVYCREFNPKGSWYAGDVSAMCIFEMTDGIVVNYRGSWCAEGFNPGWGSRWRVIGTKGTALWGDGEARAQVVTGKEGFTRKLRDVAAPKVKDFPAGHPSVMDEFLRCLRTGKAPTTVADDNIKSLAMVYGAIESATKGRRVEIRM